MLPIEKPIGILAGVTASGKTALALELAQKSGNIEIINADSLLVYRGMDIGTAKPTFDERRTVPHHLIDIRNPSDAFTSAEFLREATEEIHRIHSRNRRALVVGGTGFYINALLFGIWNAPPTDPVFRESLSTIDNAELYRQLECADPQAAQRIGPQDRYRLIRALEIISLSGSTPTSLQEALPKHPNPQVSLWITDRANVELQERIRNRTQEMLQQGLIEEYKKISAEFPQSKALGSVGYAQVAAFLKGELPSGRKIRPGEQGLQDEIELATRQLVKRQRTWFRNQTARVPTAKLFILDDQRQQLEDEFKRVYV